MGDRIVAILRWLGRVLKDTEQMLLVELVAIVSNVTSTSSPLVDNWLAQQTLFTCLKVLLTLEVIQIGGV